jgi:putative two-component system response regulator
MEDIRGPVGDATRDALDGLLARPLADARILVLDDEPANVALLEQVLRREGYERVEALTEPRAALERFRAEPPDLLLLDLHMPALDGFEVLAALAPWVLGRPRIPVLVLTADTTHATKLRALGGGARDFLVKPFDLTEVRLRIANLLETRLLHQGMLDQAGVLEARVRARTAELVEARVEVLERLGRAAEFRDDDTHRHTERVGALAARLAEHLGWPPDEVEVLRRAAPLHDLGKIGIPDAILLKPGPLDAAELAQMRDHPGIGARILSGSRGRLLGMAERIALHHHERWDGTGYPEGLAGEAIPEPARIVSVADVWDVLTHARPYKRAWTPQDALATLEQERDRQLDGRVVGALLAVLGAG